VAKSREEHNDEQNRVAGLELQNTSNDVKPFTAPGQQDETVAPFVADSPIANDVAPIDATSIKDERAVDPLPLGDEAAVDQGNSEKRELSPPQGGVRPSQAAGAVAAGQVNLGPVPQVAATTVGRPPADAVGQRSPKSIISSEANGVSAPHRLFGASSPIAAEAGENSGGPRVDTARFVGRVTRAFHFAQERGGTLQLRLSPPELGSLRLELIVKDGVLSANLEAETPAAKQLLLENLPALRERLAEQNVRVERFDVDIRRENQDAQNSAQQHSQQRQPNRGEERHSSPRLTNRPAKNVATTSSAVRTPVTVTTSSGINLVI
jgi:flagellar hook-length control protein FliK